MGRPAKPLTPLSEDRRTLAAAYWPLVIAETRGFRASWPSLAEEFVGAAGLAICQAASRHDGRDSGFATLIRLAVRSACLNELYRWRRRAEWASPHPLGPSLPANELRKVWI